MKAIQVAGEMHEVVEKKKAKSAAKNAALAASSTAPVELKVQEDHQNALEMKQQPFAFRWVDGSAEACIEAGHNL